MDDDDDDVGDDDNVENIIRAAQQVGFLERVTDLLYLAISVSISLFVLPHNFLPF